MSSEKLPKSPVNPKARAVAKFAMFLGLGLGFSGELAGSAWLGWWIGHWWVTQDGPKQAPGLCAMGFVVLSLCHIIWLLSRIMAAQEAQNPEETP